MTTYVDDELRVYSLERAARVAGMRTDTLRRAVLSGELQAFRDRLTPAEDGSERLGSWRIPAWAIRAYQERMCAEDAARRGVA